MNSADTFFLLICERAARLGGKVLLDYRSKFATQEKGKNDFVTDADFASQKVIHDTIAKHFPDHGFLGEEDLDLALIKNKDSPFQWIVDPLDGTMNYVHQLPSYSVSIALQHEGKIIAAAVFDPWLDEMYLAADRSPSTLNGTPIAVSKCNSLPQALAVISLPGNFQSDSAEAGALMKVLTTCRSMRRLGSAALNLCYVAAGRLDTYWATQLSTWDVAAGVLIVQQAGGTVTGSQGEVFDMDKPHLIAAANSDLGTAFAELVADK